MEHLLGYVLVSGLAFYVGYKLCEYHLITKMLSLLTDEELADLQRLKEQLDNATEEDADRIIDEAGKKVNLKMIKLEIVDGQYFFYDFKDNFICQGLTKEQAVTNFLKVDKTSKRACVVAESGDKFFIVDGVITNEQPQ